MLFFSFRSEAKEQAEKEEEEEEEEEEEKDPRWLFNRVINSRSPSPSLVYYYKFLNNEKW